MLQDNKDNDNIVPFKKPAPAVQKIKHPPAINIPPVTLFFTLLLVGIYAVMTALDFFAPNIRDFLYVTFGFTPESIMRLNIFAPLTLITYALLHASWLHVGMNSLMLVAFGAGIEKGMGTKSYMIIFWGSSVIAALVHFAIDPYSPIPIVGASGGISGLFGAVILMLRDQGSPIKILPLIILWIAISALFGFMGAPDGSSIAWIAHIGGFLGGLAITQYLKR